MWIREVSILNLQRFVEGCGGLDAAAAKLGILSSTLKTRLAGAQGNQSKIGFYRPIDEGQKKSIDEEQFYKLSLKFRATVKDKLGAVRLADRMGVSPSSIRKILAGEPISFGLRKKILAAARGRPGHRKRATIKRLKQAYRLYIEERSLERAGRKMGITRERVRQLLVEGAQLGLYDYKPFHRSNMPTGKNSRSAKAVFA